MTADAGRGSGGKREGRVPPSGRAPDPHFLTPLRGRLDTNSTSADSAPTVAEGSLSQDSLHSLDAVTSMRRVTRAAVLVDQTFRVTPVAMPTPTPIVAPTVAPSDPATPDPTAAPPTTPTSITAHVSHLDDDDDLPTHQA